MQTYVSSSQFLVQNFESQYFWGFQKMNIFLGYEDFVDIFWGHHKNWTILRGHFYALYGLFLRSRYRIGDKFWIAKISNIFWGVLEIPDIFWGEW